MLPIGYEKYHVLYKKAKSGRSLRKKGRSRILCFM